MERRRNDSPTPRQRACRMRRCRRGPGGRGVLSLVWPLDANDVAALFESLRAPWWIVGGWAIEAFTGRPRPHDDIDIGFFRADLPIIIERLEPGLCVWSNLSGTLRP